VKIQPNPNITPHFKLREFDCRDGSIVPAKYHANLLRLCNLLEDIRELFGGRMIHITSGYRSPEWNARLIKQGRKAAKNSQHMVAAAADFQVEGMLIGQVQSALIDIHDGDIKGHDRDIAKRVYKEMRGLGLGAHQGFVHVDVREGKRAKWTY
jgi:uncharacterized protein YcbK (DUF882 family)